MLLRQSLTSCGYRMSTLDFGGAACFVKLCTVPQLSHDSLGHVRYCPKTTTTSSTWSTSLPFSASIENVQAQNESGTRPLGADPLPHTRSSSRSASTSSQRERANFNLTVFTYPSKRGAYQIKSGKGKGKDRKAMPSKPNPQAHERGFCRSPWLGRW